MLALVLSLLPMSADLPPSPEARQFAIVIGHNATAQASVAPLEFADDDAVATYELLIDAGVAALLYTEMDADTHALHPELVPNGPPSRDAILAGFAQLVPAMRMAKQSGEDVRFLLFYSGHGDVQNGEGFVELAGGRLTRRMLFNDILSRSPASSNHVFIDACKSYFMAFDRGPGGERAPYDGLVPKFAASVSANTGFVLSTSSARDSHEWEPFFGGVFSHEMRSALWGADVNGDGQVSYAELGAFLTTANAGIPNRRLRPDFAVVPPGGPNWDQAALVWPANHPSVVFDKEVGHIFGETEVGSRLFDLHPRLSPLSQVRVPKGRRVFLHDGRESWERIIDPPLLTNPTLISALPAQARHNRRRGAVHLALHELFSQPFGAPELVDYEVRVAMANGVSATQTFVATDGPSGNFGTIAAWAAGGAALAGIGLDLWAWQRHASGGQASHRERVDLNAQIRNMRIGAMICYGAAAVGAGVWGANLLWGGNAADGSAAASAAMVILPEEIGFLIRRPW